MPRNGSGSYSLPAGNPVVTGTTISSTTHNNTMSDIASEMTNSVDKDGQTVLTGVIDHNGNNIILDTDGDTLLDLGTDDQVGVTIAGAGDFLLLANIFRALSGSVIETNTINETTAASGVTIDGVLLKDNTVLAGTLLLGAGSITDSSGAISFGNENISTTGTLDAGDTDITGTLGVSGDTTISGDVFALDRTAKGGEHATWFHQEMGHAGMIVAEGPTSGGIDGAHYGENMYIRAANGTLDYLTTAGASWVRFSDGSTYFVNAASGTADAEISQVDSMTIGTTGGITMVSTLDVSGALSKGSGSFKISHPLPELTETHHLVHSFTESPQADLLYSGVADLVNGKAKINIDTFHRMTEGTFEVLCRNVRTFSSNETGFHHVRCSVEGNILSLECEDPDCVDTVSWLVIGERKDQHMFDTGWTNENGEVIVEPLKPEPVPEPKREPVQRTVEVAIMDGDEPVTKLETVNIPEKVELIDGVATLIPATTEEQLKPQFETVGVFDTDGNPVYV